MQNENRQNETGGYQAGYSSDFMDGGKDDRGNEEVEAMIQMIKADQILWLLLQKAVELDTSLVV